MSIRNDGGDDLDQLFAETDIRPPGTSRRLLIATVVTVFAVILAVIAVVADGAARGAAEDAVVDELADRLPAGAGPIEATIGGFAFLPQFFSGTLDELAVSFALDGETIPALAGDGGAASAVQISGGTMTHEGAVELLGIQIGYVVTLEPSVEGGAVVLTPTSVEATTDAASIDLGTVVDLEALTMRACAASLLPESMELTGVEASGSQLHFSVSGRDVPIDINELKTRGSCE